MILCYYQNTRTTTVLTYSNFIDILIVPTQSTNASLYDKLAQVHSAILKYCVIPQSFTIGVITPVLKKSILNPNCPENYRPITVSSVHSKILKMFLSLRDTACDKHYGSRKDRGTYMPCILMNDILQYYKSTNSHMFVLSTLRNASIKFGIVVSCVS